MDLRQVATRVAAPTLSPQGCTSLVSLLALLRAAFLLHQIHHWQIGGDPFYGDHLLLQRLYEGEDPEEGGGPADEIDALAEKIVGHFGMIPPAQFAQTMGQFVANFSPASLDPNSMLTSSLEIEKVILSTITSVRQTLETGDELSDGMDNLLQGIADAHETFVYLLQQRIAKAQ
jgi:DNA-binding ferritin-like protein